MWKIEEVDTPPFKPNRLRLVLNPDKSWVPAALALRKRSMIARFAAAVAGCPELAAYRDRAGQDQEMRDTLARVELEIKEIAMGMEVAKADLSGEPLATQLARLDRQRTAANARIADLKVGLKLFAADVERDCAAASAALVRIAHQTSKEAYLAARKDMEAAKERFHVAASEHLDAITELLLATRPPHDAEYGELITIALDGTIDEYAAIPASLNNMPSDENAAAPAADPTRRRYRLET